MSETAPKVAPPTLEQQKANVENDEALKYSPGLKAHMIGQIEDKIAKRDAEAAAETAETPESPEAEKSDAETDAKKLEEKIAIAGIPMEEAIKDPELFKKVVANALGETVFATLSDTMVERLRTEKDLNEIIEGMNINGRGTTIEGKPELIERFMGIFARAEARAATAAVNKKGTNPDAPTDGEDDTDEDDDAPVGRVGLTARAMAFGANRQAKKEEKRARRIADLRAQGHDDAEIQRRLERGDKIRAISKYAMAAVAIVGGGMAIKYGADHGWFSGGGSGAKDQLPAPGNPNVDPNQHNLNDYFNVHADKPLHHANDFWPGSEALANGNKEGATKDLETMFRSNPNVAAMWASELGLPTPDGVTDMPQIPTMPSIDVIQSDPGAVSAFDAKINALGDWLNGHPEVRLKLTNELVDAFKNGNLGNQITLEPGYISTGTNNTAGMFFAGSRPPIAGQPNQTFLDSYVGYDDVKAHVWTINGKDYIVEDNCLQLAKVPVHQIAAQPVASVPVVSHPAEVVTQRPPVVTEQPPVVTPPEITTPPVVTEPPITTPPIDTNPPVPYVKGPAIDDGNVAPAGPGVSKLPDFVQQIQQAASGRDRGGGNTTRTIVDAFPDPAPVDRVTGIGSGNQAPAQAVTSIGTGDAGTTNNGSLGARP